MPTTGPAKGVLIDGMSLITNQGGRCPYVRPSRCGKGSTFTAAVIRSTDGGTTWSAAIPIDVQQVASVQIAGQTVRSSDEFPEFAANPVNGNLYAVWQDAGFSPTGASKTAFSQSSDGGLTWSPVIRIDQSPGNTPAFLPQIHVASDGTVGLLYYDLQNATAAQPGLTDAFIAHFHSATIDCANPASWASGGETRLSTSGSFDYTTAPTLQVCSSATTTVLPRLAPRSRRCSTCPGRLPPPVSQTCSPTALASAHSPLPPPCPRGQGEGARQAE